MCWPVSFFQRRSTALHPHFEQTFTGCFDAASTKRQTKSAHTGSMSINVQDESHTRL
jgi:hypothetical protein